MQLPGTHTRVIIAAHAQTKRGPQKYKAGAVGFAALYLMQGLQLDFALGGVLHLGQTEQLHEEGRTQRVSA